MKTKTAKPARGRVVSFHEIAERVKAVAKGVLTEEEFQAQKARILGQA